MVSEALRTGAWMGTRQLDPAIEGQSTDAWTDVEATWKTGVGGLCHDEVSSTSHRWLLWAAFSRVRRYAYFDELRVLFNAAGWEERVRKQRRIEGFCCARLRKAVMGNPTNRAGLYWIQRCGNSASELTVIAVSTVKFQTIMSHAESLVHVSVA